MILPLLAIGAIGGLLSGLFGIGGGLVMVPLMMAWLRFDQRRASATSLFAIIPPALLSASLYGVRGEIDLLVAAVIAVGAIAAFYKIAPDNAPRRKVIPKMLPRVMVG